MNDKIPPQASSTFTMEETVSPAQAAIAEQIELPQSIPLFDLPKADLQYS